MLLASQQPLPVHVVSQQRDIWDWALIVVGLVAGIGAVIAIWTWIIQQRKTPEVAFRWKYEDKLWTDEPALFGVDRDNRIQVDLINVGTGAAPGAIANLMVPAWMEIEYKSDETDKWLPNFTAHEVAVSSGPKKIEMKWVGVRIREFYPSVPFVMSFSVKIQERTVKHNDSYFVAASIEGDGFNASGHRRWPSWAHRLPTQISNESSSSSALPDDPGFWEQPQWPGRRYRRRLRQVRALPSKTVRCGPGKRVDRRPFRVDWESQSRSPGATVDGEDPGPLLDPAGGPPNEGLGSYDDPVGVDDDE